MSVFAGKNCFLICAYSAHPPLKFFVGWIDMFTGFQSIFPLSQNMIYVVNFDFTFQFVLTGWEGAALDGKFLQNALQKGFKIKPGK